MAQNYFKENAIKNVIVITIAVFLYPVISMSIAPIKPEQINDFLLIISMLLVTVCFANFAFTYEKSKLQIKTGKLLAHSATGVFILLTAILLESITLSVKVVCPSFHAIIFGFSVLTYLGIILYDFWDLMRAQ
ncbi:MAG: hypothetical protein WCX97_03700 [Candidatus Magasanikbacteria bacterium]